MVVHLYKIECLTNLHVGSGDINYNVVDNEVEKDINGYPIIHSSGLKGALREQAEKEQFKGNDAKVQYIFGQKSGSTEIIPGKYKFFDANIISRPMRVQGCQFMASIPVFSIASVDDYLKKITAFGVNPYSITELDKSLFNFEPSPFISTEKNIYIEGKKAEVFSPELKKKLDELKNVLGEKYAVVKDFDHYPLPVLARNYLEDGKSKNLWYEEVVPHGSIFYTIIITPAETNELDMNKIKQIGGHASIGCDFTKFTKIEKESCDNE